MRIVGLEEMQRIEQDAWEHYGIGESLIIENVGLRGADFIYEKFLHRGNFGEVVCLIGRGNNGADGLAIARHLVNRGVHVRAFLLFPDEACTEENKKQVQMSTSCGVKISEIRELHDLSSYLTQTQDRYFVIDAIFGTGIRLPISNYLFELITMVNENASVIVSVDIPSGVNGERGEISGVAMRAQFTLVVGPAKLGHFLGDGPLHIGKLVHLDGGLPQNLLAGGDKFLLTEDNILTSLVSRSNFSHKHRFGHVLLIGGSQGLTGALIMAAMGALRVGTGLATAATWPTNYGELATRITPEIMIGMLPRTASEQLEAAVAAMNRYDAIVIGPGLGRHPDARAVVLAVLNNYARPVLLDADAIAVLSFEQDREIFQARKGPTIITPHLAEFSRFIGSKLEDVQKRPLDFVRAFVDKTNATIVLKGPSTILAFPNGEIAINHRPNSGMSSGGVGDVLAGILGG